MTFNLGVPLIDKIRTLVAEKAKLTLTQYMACLGGPFGALASEKAKLTQALYMTQHIGRWNQQLAEYPHEK